MFWGVMERPNFSTEADDYLSGNGLKLIKVAPTARREL